MPTDRTSRGSLFEALAVHLGLLPQRALAQLRDEIEHPSGGSPLSEPVLEKAELSVAQRTILDAATQELLARYDGDVCRCLESLGAFPQLRHELEGCRTVSAVSGYPTLAAAQLHSSDDSRSPDHAQSSASLAYDDTIVRGGSSIRVDPNVVQISDEDRRLGTISSMSARFHVMRPHAEGGIGRVSLAFDSELQREVVLKQIKPERADDAESRARFLIEAEVTGCLEHPGIVPVYGLGLDGQGRPYYAMRFVRGTSFEEAIRRFHAAEANARRDSDARTLELRYLLARFVDVCQTVAYAHSRGVLHRDLKPANVLLGQFNESLVVDWGLAKVLTRVTGLDGNGPEEDRSSTPAPPAENKVGSAVKHNRQGATELVESDHGSRPLAGESSGAEPLGLSSSTDTAAGIAFGTPAFMSPEQTEGKADQVGPASDVYSLGAMLYTLLCGKAPFDYVWCDVTGLINRVRRGEFATPRKVNARVSRALEAVCLKAMALRPADRYTSAAALSSDIEQWLADGPVSAYREPVPARLARWGRHHKPIVAAASVLLIAAVAASRWESSC